MESVSSMEASTESPPIKTILIVEDDADISDFLGQVLKEETPYQVLQAVDGFQALKQVRSVLADLVLLDYWLPGMDGLECLDQLRASKGMEQTPVILMSAKLPARAKELSYVWLLEKPFELEALLKLIQELLPGTEES